MPPVWNKPNHGNSNSINNSSNNNNKPPHHHHNHHNIHHHNNHHNSNYHHHNNNGHYNSNHRFNNNNKNNGGNGIGSGGSGVTNYFGNNHNRRGGTNMNMNSDNNNSMNNNNNNIHHSKSPDGGGSSSGAGSGFNHGVTGGGNTNNNANSNRSSFGSGNYSKNQYHHHHHKTHGTHNNTHNHSPHPHNGKNNFRGNNNSGGGGGLMNTLNSSSTGNDGGEGGSGAITGPNKNTTKNFRSNFHASNISSTTNKAIANPRSEPKPQQQGQGQQQGQQHVQQRHNSVEEGEIAASVNLNATSTSSHPTILAGNPKFIPPKGAPGHRKFIPNNSISNNGYHHNPREEGEIQSSAPKPTTAAAVTIATAAATAPAAASTITSSKPIWIPPPGASSLSTLPSKNSSNTSTTTTNGSKISTNSTGGTNNNVVLNQTVSSSLTSPPPPPPQFNNNNKKRWNNRVLNNDNNNHNSSSPMKSASTTIPGVGNIANSINTMRPWNNNRKEGPPNHNNNSQIANSGNKWDKPNHFKKRFVSDNPMTMNKHSGPWNNSSRGGGGGGGSVGSNNSSSNGGGSSGFHGNRASSLPHNINNNNNNPASTWRRNPLHFGGANSKGSTGEYTTSDSNVNNSGYYGPSPVSSSKLDKVTNASTNNNDNGRNYYSNNDMRGDIDHFPSPTLRKKIFQPPPGKEKNYQTSQQPPHNIKVHSHNFPPPHLPLSNTFKDNQDRDNSKLSRRPLSAEKMKPTPYASPSSPDRFNKQASSCELSSRKPVNESGGRWKPASNFEIGKLLSRSPPFEGSDVKKGAPTKTLEKINPSEIPKIDNALTLAPKIAPRVINVDSIKATNDQSDIPTNSKRGSSSGTTEADQVSNKDTNTPFPPRLTCAALGNPDKASKARKLVSKLSLPKSDDKLNDLYLPTTDQIHSMLKDLESQIEKNKSECNDIEKEQKISHRDEDKRAISTDKARESIDNGIDSTSKEPKKGEDMSMSEQLKDATEMLISEKKTEENQLNSKLEDVKIHVKKVDEQIDLLLKEQSKIELAREQALIESELVTKLKENENIIEQIELQCREARSAYEISKSSDEKKADKLKLAQMPDPVGSTFIDTAEKVKDSKLVTKASVSKQLNHYSKLISPRLNSLLFSMKDEPEEMSNLIASIYQNNRQVATHAQEKALSLIAFTPLVEGNSPPSLMTEQDVDVDDNAMLGHYFQQWSNSARQVTGQSDALYNEPSQTPHFESIKQNNETMRGLVKEHIRSKKRKLHTRWVELAEEYVVRQEKYSKETTIASSSYTSADTENLPILAGGNDFSPDASGGRSTANPYRRARRGAVSGMGGSDVVRSEYEQQQIIAQLEAKANMERRIKKGRSELPRQQCQLEKEMFASYRDTMTSRVVRDPLQETYKQRQVNPWSDIEKCIFLDRFLQHPKEFKKIASFLKNKSVHDCIAFYYDSKKTVSYKRALREHFKRKKRSRDSVKWEATIQAAISVGATVRAGVSEEKPLIFELPRDDLTFHTRYFHPMGKEIVDAISYGNPTSFEVSTIQEVKKPSRKRKSSMIGDLFILEPTKRKFLRTITDSDRNSTSNSDTEKGGSSSTAPTSLEILKADKNETSKKTSQKWSSDEKALFHDNFKKLGKKWDLIAEAIGTKTAVQVKKFYIENKKQINKNKTNSKGKRTNKKAEGDQPLSKPVSLVPESNEASSTSSQTPVLSDKQEQPKIRHGFVQENVSGGYEVPEMATTNQAQGQWMQDNQQRQLNLAIEQHRQRLNHQQSMGLSQSQHQQLLEFQQQLQQQEEQRQLNEHHRQLQQQRHIQTLLSQHHGHQQSMLPNLNLSSWVVAQAAQAAIQQQEARHQLQDMLDGGNNVHSLVMALRQASQNQNQNNFQMNLNASINNNDNDGSRQQAASELSLLAQIAAADAQRNNQRDSQR